MNESLGLGTEGRLSLSSFHILDNYGSWKAPKLASSSVTLPLVSQVLICVRGGPAFIVSLTSLAAPHEEGQ